MKYFLLFVLSVQVCFGAVTKNQLDTSVPELITANTTITVCASGCNYTTLNAAYLSLANKIIAKDKTVTISLGNEIINESLTTALNHINGKQISIVGGGLGAQQQVGSINGQRRNTVVTANYADYTFITAVPTGITTAGQMLCVAMNSGTYIYTNGCFEVDQVNGLRVTVKVPRKDFASGALTVAGNVYGYAMKTVLVYPASYTGLSLTNGAKGSISGFGIITSGTGNIINLYKSGDLSMSTIGIANAHVAINATLDCVVDCISFCFFSNSQVAIRAAYKSMVVIQDYAVNNVVQYGFYATENSTIVASAGSTYGVSSKNTGGSFLNQSMSYAQTAAACSTNYYDNCSPAVGTDGNGNSRIE